MDQMAAGQAVRGGEIWGGVCVVCVCVCVVLRVNPGPVHDR
jgi:hypothetical protein